MQLSLAKAAQRDIDVMHAFGVQNSGRGIANDDMRQHFELLDLLEDTSRMGT